MKYPPLTPSLKIGESWEIYGLTGRVVSKASRPAKVGNKRKLTPEADLDTVLLFDLREVGLGIREVIRIKRE